MSTQREKIVRERERKGGGKREIEKGREGGREGDEIAKARRFIYCCSHSF